MDNQKPETASDDIDLGQFLAKIGNGFKNAGMSFLRALANLRRIPIENSKLFIGLGVFAVIAGLGYASFVKKKFYKSTMIFSSEYLNKRIVDNAIANLSLLAEEKNKKGLAKVLGIPDSIAMNIADFEANPFVDEKNVVELEILKEQLKNAGVEKKNEKVIDQVIRRIEIENRHAFEFTIWVYSPSVVQTLQNSILIFFKNNEYIRKRIDINKENLLARKHKLLRESQKLDSLKQIIYSNFKSMADRVRQGSNNVILSDNPVTSPVDVYLQDLQLYDQIQVVDKELYLQSDFELIDGFTQFSEPASASLAEILAISLLIAFGSGYLLVGIMHFNRYLAKLE